MKTTTWKGIITIIKASSKGFKLGGKVEGKIQPNSSRFSIKQR